MEVNLKNFECYVLNENEMAEIKGGGRWVVINGKLVFVDDKKSTECDGDDPFSADYFL